MYSVVHYLGKLSRRKRLYFYAGAQKYKGRVLSLDFTFCLGARKIEFYSYSYDVYENRFQSVCDSERVVLLYFFLTINVIINRFIYYEQYVLQYYFIKLYKMAIYLLN